VYFIFALIDLLSFSPITRAKDSDYVVPVRKTHGEDALPDLAEAEVPLLCRTVRLVFGKDALGICECELCLRERDTVLFQVLAVLS
jgi:hypothetical protein